MPICKFPSGWESALSWWTVKLGGKNIGIWGAQHPTGESMWGCRNERNTSCALGKTGRMLAQRFSWVLQSYQSHNANFWLCYSVVWFFCPFQKLFGSSLLVPPLLLKYWTIDSFVFSLHHFGLPQTYVTMQIISDTLCQVASMSSLSPPC